MANNITYRVLGPQSAGLPDGTTFKTTESGGAHTQHVKVDAMLAGLEIPAHDYISLGYTGSNLTTVVYKTGGSGGTTVATLTLAYSGSDLVSVTKT